MENQCDRPPDTVLQFWFRAKTQDQQIQEPLPDVLTHVDLTVDVDLADVVADPDGDRVFYRIVGVSGGTAVLGPDGRSAEFTPDPVLRERARSM